LALGYPMNSAGVKKFISASLCVIISLSTIVNNPTPGRIKFLRDSIPAGSQLLVIKTNYLP
jgi:hypothetical protein